MTQADGDNRIRALAACADSMQAIQYPTPATKGWRTKVLTRSAQYDEGADVLWDTILESHQVLVTNDAPAARRRE
jgi:LAO/AO transport system kinase